MEYTKDMIFKIDYKGVNSSKICKENNWTSRFLEAIKRHKIVTASVISAFILISADVILISNFFSILSTL